MIYNSVSDCFSTGYQVLTLINDRLDVGGEIPHEIGRQAKSMTKKLAGLPPEEGVRKLQEMEPELVEWLTKSRNRCRIESGVLRYYIYALSDGFFGAINRGKVVDQADSEILEGLYDRAVASLNEGTYATLINNVVSFSDTLFDTLQLPAFPASARIEGLKLVDALEELANTFSLLEEFHFRLVMLVRRKLASTPFAITNSEVDQESALRSIVRSTRRTIEPRLEKDFTVWRYFTIVKFIALLNTQSLYFPSASTLSECSDPEEGEYTDADLDDFLNLLEDFPILRNSMKELVKEMKDTTYINSWNIGPNESEELWKEYAPHGLVIRSSYKRLRASFNTPLEIIISKVRYVDPSIEKSDRASIYAPFALKRSRHARDSEIRVMFANAIEPAARGRSVNVNLDTLIEEVRLAPGCENWEVEVYRQLLERYDLSKPVRLSEL